MLSILSHSPVVFLRLAELQESEIDLKLVPDAGTGFNAFNYTQIEQLMIDRELEIYQYSAPRFRLSGSQARWYSPWRCKSSQDERLDLTDMFWPYLGTDHGRNPDTYNRSTQVFDPELEATYRQAALDSEIECFGVAGACVDKYCTKPAENALYLIDFEREKRMGLGRDFPVRSVFCHGTTSTVVIANLSCVAARLVVVVVVMLMMMHGVAWPASLRKCTYARFSRATVEYHCW